MAARIDITEKLRTQVRELEKDKRDIQRRYNEQVSLFHVAIFASNLTSAKASTFEAERQAFYDNEQHLKSRIQSLTQARKQPLPPLTSPSVASIAETETDEMGIADVEAPEVDEQDVNDPEQEPAEMIALKLELSTLSTSYSSLQQTLVLLQTQLNDLKRVNNELQEENESYNILLRERTLNGQFDVLRMGGGTSISEASASEAGDDDEAEGDSSRDGESLMSRNTGRSVLDPVEELTESELDPAFKHDGEQSREGSEAGETASSARRHARRHSKSHSPQARGESLANLPITGPGLDLAAELGRAENKDILEGRVPLDNERVVPGGRRKSRKASDGTRKVSVASEPGMETGLPDDLDALRNEVKSLKDANKALSLYASKIIDRIISQEGFEHVLAVDYDSKAPQMTPNTAATFTTFSNKSNSQPMKKGRPQSAIFSLSSSSQNGPASPGLTTFNSPPTPNTASPPKPPASARASRRSMSFDWKSFSMFGGNEKKPEPNPNLKPLTLRAGSSPVVTSARKLDTFEDEEDRRERERLHATMKLMGIEKPPTVQKSYSEPANPSRPSSIDTSVINSPVTATTATATNPATPSTRFSFFRRTNSMTASEAPSQRSSTQGSPYISGANTPNLTQEALEQAEAESSLAALDAHERQLSAEIAKGSPGGFTEIPRRSSDRRSSRKSGSGSTVWSAGMSKGEDGDD